MKILSICIPTYNRLPFLKELLNELTTQINTCNLTEFIEIVISDNNSLDGTQEYLLDIFHQHDGLVKINFLPQNNGPDYNFHQVVSIATGKFIWIFGDDDLPTEKAISKLVEIIKVSEYDLYFLGYDLYSKDMTKCYGQHPYMNNFHDSVFCGVNGFVKFGYMLGYMSAIVLSKKAFTSITYPQKYLGTFYIHVAWCADILIRQNLCIKLIKDSFVQYRLENDSLLNSCTSFERVMIDVQGYNKIGQAYLSKNMFRTFYMNIFHYHVNGRLLQLIKLPNYSFSKIMAVYYKYFWLNKIGLNYKDLTNIIRSTILRGCNMVKNWF